MSNYSPSLPLVLSPVNGFENNQTILEVVEQNLKMLLLTSQGERVMDPNFGIGIKNYLFEQNDIQTHSKIEVNIIKQVREYLPYVEIVDVLFSYENNNSNIMSNGLLITIKFYVASVGILSSLTVEV